MVYSVLKIFLIGVVAMAILQSCAKTENDYNPNAHLTPQQKDSLLTGIIRYVAKAPEKVKESDKFSSAHNTYYQKRVSETRLERYFKKDNETFFLVSQPAPSLRVKRHATGGKFRTDGEGKMITYEEVFRTWKMTPDTLQARSYFLFDKMVNEEPLSPYYTENSNGVDYIEFPDDRTYFDKTSRAWKLK